MTLQGRLTFNYQQRDVCMHNFLLYHYAISCRCLEQVNKGNIMNCTLRNSHYNSIRHYDPEERSYGFHPEQFLSATHTPVTRWSMSKAKAAGTRDRPDRLSVLRSLFQSVSQLLSSSPVWSRVVNNRVYVFFYVRFWLPCSVWQSTALLAAFCFVSYCLAKRRTD